MYGTVARMKANPGAGELLARFNHQMTSDPPPGLVATWVYRMDADPDEYMLAVAFESQEAYKANADSPEQNARFLQLRALLAADPEWHDGEIVFTHGSTAP
jgi:heme-degrading monooxygenase HmoA